MIEIGYANAFYEVLQILKYTDIDDYEKIPAKLIRTFRIYANYNYDFEYDVNKTLDEQHVSNVAKAIIANIFKEYWATPIQKEKIIAKEEYDRMQLEEAKRKKYDPDNLFKNKETMIESKPLQNEVALVEIRENFFTRCIKKIKNIFHTK